MDIGLHIDNEERLKLIVQFNELISFEESLSSPHQGRINMLIALKNNLKTDFLKQKYLLN